MTVKPLNRHEADRIADTVAGIAARLARRTHAKTALAHTAQRAIDWQPGVRSSAAATGRSAGGISDPTGQAVVAADAYDDPSARWAGELTTAARKLNAVALLVEQLVAKIDGHDEPRPRDQTKHCANLACAITIETHSTELAGMDWCGPCYDYRLRNQGRDAPHDVVSARERKRRERDVSRTRADA